MLEAQWGGLPATRCGAAVPGMLPELGGGAELDSRAFSCHPQHFGPPYLALSVEPVAFRLDARLGRLFVTRVHPPTSTACVSCDLPSSFCRHRLPSRPRPLRSLLPPPRRAFLSSAWLPPIPLTGLCSSFNPSVPPKPAALLAFSLLKSVQREFVSPPLGGGLLEAEDHGLDGKVSFLH